MVVENAGDRPIQVGSHYHFADVNPALELDRQAAQGFWLDIPAGTAAGSLEPGTARRIMTGAPLPDELVLILVMSTGPRVHARVAGLKAAAAWREHEAQTRDMPRQRVIKDEGLYEIAHAAPTTPEQLSQLRSIPRGFERSKPAERLLEALKIALSDPKKHAPSVTAPMMPNPPAVMFNACQGFLPSPKYFWWSVITWYRRPPMMPAGMITIAASHTVSGLPPRAL